MLVSGGRTFQGDMGGWVGQEELMSGGTFCGDSVGRVREAELLAVPGEKRWYDRFERLSLIWN